MTEYAYRVYESVIQATSSELILFFIIFAVVLAVVLVPIYAMILKDRKDRRKGNTESETVKHDKHLERESKMIERERQILEVIKENSAVIAGLKVTLESSGETTKATLERIHTRIDDLNNTISGISTEATETRVKVENSLGNQTEMSSKINKILLIVDKIPRIGSGGIGGDQCEAVGTVSF